MSFYSLLIYSERTVRRKDHQNSSGFPTRNRRSRSPLPYPRKRPSARDVSAATLRAQAQVTVMPMKRGRQCFRSRRT
jgi:hypothetical protein